MGCRAWLSTDGISPPWIREYFAAINSATRTLSKLDSHLQRHLEAQPSPLERHGRALHRRGGGRGGRGWRVGAGSPSRPSLRTTRAGLRTAASSAPAPPGATRAIAADRGQPDRVRGVRTAVRQDEGGCRERALELAPRPRGRPPRLAGRDALRTRRLEQPRAEPHPLGACRSLVRASPALSHELIEDSEFSPLPRERALLALPCSSRSIRGYAASFIAFDEMAFFVDEEQGGPRVAQRLWSSLTPSIAQFGQYGKVVAISTPPAIATSLPRCTSAAGVERSLRCRLQRGDGREPAHRPCLSRGAGGGTWPGGLRPRVPGGLRERLRRLHRLGAGPWPVSATGKRHPGRWKELDRVLRSRLLA